MSQKSASSNTSQAHYPAIVCYCYRLVVLVWLAVHIYIVSLRVHTLHTQLAAIEAAAYTHTHTHTHAPTHTHTHMPSTMEPR